MKKFIAFCLLLICVLTLISCNNKDQCITISPDDTGAAPIDTADDELDSDTVFKATVGIRNNDHLILYTNDPAGLYTISLSGLELIGCSKGDVVPGMTVEIEYSGMIMESYPAQLSAPTSLKITGGQADDICKMYADLAEMLWKEDDGLNGPTCALEIKDDTVSENQKRVIAYELQNRLGFETSVILSTREELEKQGVIDKENLYFKDGALITITADKESNTGKSFDFSAQKWASGTGAIFFFDCKARQNNGVWSYELGGFAIS